MAGRTVLLMRMARPGKKKKVLMLQCLLLCLLGQTSRACTSSANILHGMGLGLPVMSTLNATSWTECCDFCSAGSTCVAWTFFRMEKICLLRDALGRHFDLRAPNKVSGIKGPPFVLVPHRNDKLWIHLGIISAPKNQDKREEIRRKCFPRFQNLVNQNRLTYEFVIGRPHDKIVDGHWQGYINQKEVAMSKKLWKEHEAFGDLSFMTSRDTIYDQPSKSLELVKRGVLRGAKYIVKMDDDMCLNIKAFSQRIRTAQDPQYGYFSNMLWPEQKYNNQKGADGKFVKYMSGPIYALTFDLAKIIAFEDINFAAMYPMYGSSSEDVDMGRWVKHAMKKHNATAQYVSGWMGDRMDQIHE